MTEEQKRIVYKAVCDLYRSRYGEDHMALGSCLYWANCGGAILRTLGYRTIPQAGTMQWPIVPKHLDDGVSATHFGYEWSPEHPASVFALANNMMPEIHVWLAIPEENTIIDFSTKFFPERAKVEYLEWRTPPPPDFLWAKADELPEGVIYHANLDAIGFVLRMVLENEGAPLERYDHLHH